MSKSAWRYTLAKRLFRTAVRAGPATRTPLLGSLYHRLFSAEDGGRVIPIDEAVTAKDGMVLPSEAVRKVVRAAGYRFIMNECLCRTAERCRHHPRDLGCVFLGQAARTIPSALGREASEAEVLEHLEACERAGLVHVMGHFRFDAIFLDAKPFERLLSLCNCCACCCIFRVYPELYRAAGDTLEKLEGVRVEVGDACTGCGACRDACFVGAIVIGPDGARISSRCRGCGRCVSLCPNGAVTLTLEGAVFPSEWLARVA